MCSASNTHLITVFTSKMSRLKSLSLENKVLEVFFGSLKCTNLQQSLSLSVPLSTAQSPLLWLFSSLLIRRHTWVQCSLPRFQREMQHRDVHFEADSDRVPTSCRSLASVNGAKGGELRPLFLTGTILNFNIDKNRFD